MTPRDIAAPSWWYDPDPEPYTADIGPEDVPEPWDDDAEREPPLGYGTNGQARERDDARVEADRWRTVAEDLAARPRLRDRLWRWMGVGR